ncbi:MAG: enoyl-CoA hydratase-related protein [Syntrophobacteraceae bacterium]|nr:enoyl-CoA hydratase-related protein [Syntrophobacteraceae bacterium]
MEYKHLIFERDNGIGIVTVNRPEAGNILNNEAWLEIEDVIERTDRDEELHVLVITGAGDKAFIGGADIRDLRERSMLETLGHGNQSILIRLASMGKITIAALNGYAIGGGCELALACDLRIAEEHAVMGQPELNLGILPGAGGTQRLTRLVGTAKAKELILTGDLVDAGEAHRIGLVNKVVPKGAALGAAKEMAAKMLKKGPLAVRLTKAVVDVGGDSSLTAGLFIEKLSQALLFTTEDHLEGLSAFLQKRPPVYKNR